MAMVMLKQILAFRNFLIKMLMSVSTRVKHLLVATAGADGSPSVVKAKNWVKAKESFLRCDSVERQTELIFRVVSPHCRRHLGEEPLAASNCCDCWQFPS